MANYRCQTLCSNVQLTAETMQTYSERPLKNMLKHNQTAPLS